MDQGTSTLQMLRDSNMKRIFELYSILDKLQSLMDQIKRKR